MRIIHFYYCIVLSITYNFFAMDSAKKSVHKNKNSIKFSHFSQLPIAAIAAILTGSPYLSIPARYNDEEKEFRQREAICLYSDLRIRNALFKVNKRYHDLFSWENINPLMCSSRLRAEDNDIYSLFLRAKRHNNIDAIEKLKSHPSLQYSFLPRGIFIIGSQKFISLSDALNPLVESCIARSSQEVANELKTKKKPGLWEYNPEEILDMCLYSIIQNNDHNSLALVLKNKSLLSMIRSLPENYSNKFIQLGIYCASHRVIRQLVSLCPNLNQEFPDYIADNFKSVKHTPNKLFTIISKNMQLLRTINNMHLNNLFYCLCIFFPISGLTILGLTQTEIQSISIEGKKGNSKTKKKKKNNFILRRLYH